MSEGDEKEGALLLETVPSWVRSMSYQPLTIPPAEQMLGTPTTGVEAEGTAGCMGGYQVKIIMGLVWVWFTVTASGARERCRRSAFLPISSVSPPPLPCPFTLHPGFWIPTVRWALRINSEPGSVWWRRGPRGSLETRICQEKLRKGRHRLPGLPNPHSPPPSPFRELFCCFVCLCTAGRAGSWFPHQGLKPCPLS